MTKSIKLPVTERALLARVDRALAKTGEHLCKSHPDSTLRHSAGTFYRVALDRSKTVATHVDLETIARELGVMADYERLDK
jgi:hypothetical protein